MNIFPALLFNQMQGFRVVRGLRGEEWLEKVILGLPVHANAGVGHTEHDIPKPELVRHFRSTPIDAAIFLASDPGA